MEEELIKNQWKEKGWIWTEKEKLLTVLDALAAEGITKVVVQVSANGYFVSKLY